MFTFSPLTLAQIPTACLLLTAPVEGFSRSHPAYRKYLAICQLTDCHQPETGQSIHALHRSFSWHVGSGLLGIEDPGKLCWYGIHGIRFIGLMIFLFSTFYGFPILTAE
ncbi:hypothetical protein BO85DRAFT_280625 [Aspergillus piperis CBS 112811]|uniref:Uncharacterized protein n=1 Tax=Aspergillus piperis CBS 112811 TaxID=1448313 RepID=A0A8G1R8I3_9EURO|nr:hypothetical protein BO85DRAFT_280625 [Aspergillus piperis CBS 112811]RAH58720.1 hypothetical protein BO85DRAFT_280625 [Aspergillus piperis CBS 112811]